MAVTAQELRGVTKTIDLPPCCRVIPRRMLTCPLLLQAALLLDPWRWRKEVALQASAAEAERLAGTELTTKPAAPANKRSTRVAPHSSLVDSHAAARRPSGGRQEDVALRAAQVAFAQPPRQGRFRLDATACGGRVSVVSLVQAVLVVVMISLSVAAELSKSFAVAVAVVAVSLLCGMAAMALMIMQLQTFRRGSRIEMRPLLTRFIVAIVCSWSMYPVVFVLGPGVGNVIDNATAVAAFAVLDILSKNAFVMWVWSAANRIWAKEKELVEVLGLRLPESSGTGFPPASPEVTRVREAPARSPLGQHERSLV